tara:strand:+ start:663 stop:968 length:306 start_codon:yes stop_codon:yes gene_type:complete
LNGYYSVFNPRGEKIADCGSERDAINLLGMRNRRWDGHYYQFNPLPGDIIDVNQQKQLGTNAIIFADGYSVQEMIEVNGKYIPIQQLPPNCQEPFIPDFHD